jgi:hypothetical protein
MTTDVVLFSVTDVQVIATAVYKSGFFGIKTAEAAFTLCMIAQAEGRHPAMAALDYDIIQGKPAKRAQAMQRDFLTARGTVEWHRMDDTMADATFSHPAGGSVRITWDMERARRANLAGKDNWRLYPRQMLRARVVSEGVRATFPMATGGLYTPEEVRDFDGPRDNDPPHNPPQPKRPVPKDMGPAQVVDESTGEITPAAAEDAAPKIPQEGENAAKAGMMALSVWWNSIGYETRKVIGAQGLATLKAQAMKADAELADVFDTQEQS